MPFLFLILGLIIGSFLNVVVYRLQTAQSLLGRSFCPKCKKQIRWYDNIPLLSFILLRFKCRDCQKKISWQYPLVELLTGIAFAFIGWKFFDLNQTGTWPVTVYYLLIISFLMVIFIYDLLYMEIPSLVLWPAIFTVMAFLLYFDWAQTFRCESPLDLAVYSGALASLLAFLFFFLLVFFSKEKWMGMGDAYLVILLGLIAGWPNILLALFLAFAIGAIVGIILILAKKKTISSQLPFAPFLIIGTLLAIFFYNPIMNYYFSFFY